MNLWDIVKSVGTGIVREVVPGGGLIVDAVNAMLPEDKKLPQNASGADIDNAVASLPPDQRAAIMSKEFDVEMTQIKESNSTVRAMLESDAKTPHTTRPKIAYQAFQLIAFTTIMMVVLWAYGVGTENDTMVKTVMDGWMFVVAANGPFVVLLHAYFGILKHEHKNRLDAANGSTGQIELSGLKKIAGRILNR